MARKRLNPRRAKIHRTYSFEEIARLFGVHKQTVRNWQKEGLPVLTGKRPYLVIGEALRTFLDKRRRSSKQQCKDGELYCLRCHAPARPATCSTTCPSLSFPGTYKASAPHVRR
jgi:hypothetical protein